MVKDYMRGVGQNTAASIADIEGYEVGGKTGTAEKLPRELGNNLVSFMGYAPQENPEIVVYVVIDEPNAWDQAQSSFAQGLCRDILKEVLPFLEVYSTIESKEDVEDNEEDKKKKEDDDEEEDNEPVNDASVMDESGNAFDNITTDVQNNTDAIINEEEEKKKKTDNDDDSDEDSEDDSDNDSRNNSNSNSSSGDEFSDELDIG
jgi:stage V sporulation protein D (sporulation-specific penicillin-binding protein)